MAEPSLRRHPVRWAAWLLDEVLDRVPGRDNGYWYRRGHWGCRLGLSRFWPLPDDDADGGRS